jgi:hypothetical protein
MATPQAPQDSSLWKISLPQTDGPGERVERITQLDIAQRGYNYDPNNKLPMPMGTDAAAGIEFLLLLSERPVTSNWVVGQLKNQAAILVDLEIWQILRRLSANTITANDAAAENREASRKSAIRMDVGLVQVDFQSITAGPAAGGTAPEPRFLCGSVYDFSDPGHRPTMGERPGFRVSAARRVKPDDHSAGDRGRQPRSKLGRATQETLIENRRCGA